MWKTEARRVKERERETGDGILKAASICSLTRATLVGSACGVVAAAPDGDNDDDVDVHGV